MQTLPEMECLHMLIKISGSFEVQPNEQNLTLRQIEISNRCVMSYSISCERAITVTRAIPLWVLKIYSQV